MTNTGIRARMPRMKRLLSKHFRQDGKPKKAYTEAEAKVQEELTHGAMSAYKCDFCSHWHVGKTK